MRVFARAPIGRGIWICVVAALGTVLEACSGSAASPITGQIGTSVGVTLNSSTGTATVQQGDAIVFLATVTSDPTNAGVTWSLVGAGTLTEKTTTSVTYIAPTGITGTVSPILTATSIADNTKTATALLVVQGTPVIDPTVLFPGNVSSPYTAQVSVSGGLAPFIWVFNGGVMPPGITLGASSTSFNTISGTPTTTGSYTFQVEVTDSNGKTSIADLTMLVKPLAACLLEGTYATLYNGFVGGQVAVGGTSLTIASDGTMTGYHDFNPAGITISESVTGTCATRTANNGTLQVIGLGNSPVFNYAMTVGLLNGREQLISGGGAQSGSGPLEKQNPADFVLSKLAGNFAFGAIGAQAGGARAGTIGAISVDTSGHVISGHADSNDSSPLTDATLTGTLTAPSPTTGRGTLTLTASGGGSRVMHFAYYIITADRLYIASLDPSFAIAGFMTRQTSPLSNSTLVNPGILTLWGAAAVFEPKTAVTLGQTAAPIRAVARSICCWTPQTKPLPLLVRRSMARSTQYGPRMAAPRSPPRSAPAPAILCCIWTGRAMATSSSSAAAWAARACSKRSPGSVQPTVPGLFVMGSQFSADSAPILLLPAVTFVSGSFTANYASGYFVLDPASGHASAR